MNSELQSITAADVIKAVNVSLRRSWAEVCRWITSLAGGSSCRGNVG